MYRSEFVLFLWASISFFALMGCNPAQGNQTGGTNLTQERPQVTPIARTKGISSGGNVFFSNVAAVNSGGYLATIVGEGRVFRLKRSDSEWHALESIPQNDWPLNSISMLDGRKGFVIGNGGTMLRTADGGDSWTQVARFTDLNLTNLKFADSSIGYLTAELGVVGESDTMSYRLEVFRTNDGGDTWKSIYSHRDFDGPVFELAVESARSMFLMIAGRKLISTPDGGNSWAEGVSSEFVADVAMMRGGLGWSVNNRGDLLRTTDYGRNWERVEVAGDLSECKWKAVDVSQDGTGIVISRDGCVAYARDGTNWRPVQSRLGESISSVFSTEQGGLIVGKQNVYQITF